MGVEFIFKIISFLIIAILFIISGSSGQLWPMENGTVQLSKVSFPDIANMDNGRNGDLASVGATKEQLKVLDIGDSGKGLGLEATKQSFVGRIVNKNDTRIKPSYFPDVIFDPDEFSPEDLYG
jgi:hypothetical protein